MSGYKLRNTVYMNKLTKQYKYIIFDFDGTINNTSPGIYATFTKVLAHFGVDAATVDLSRHIGPPLTDSYTHLVGAERCDEAIELHKGVFAADRAAENSYLYDGIVDVLKALRQSGKFTMAIASSKYEPHAVESLKYHRIEQYFDCVYGQTEKRGFKAEVLRQLVEDNGWDVTQCLMIGDTLHDVEGAHANGIDVVAVTYGFGKRDELANSHPIALCDRPSDILKLLL
ncbi:MAG: HAD hydrolase-like protein [Clostridiales bacterium]|nr:HAD hydrolase-like protein [Clostridiales bacterium]